MRAVLLSTVCLAGLPVFAGDLSIDGGAALSFRAVGDPATKPAFNAYVEGDLANFYLGASGDIYNDSTSNKVDLSLGYRNTIASGLAYDLSYTRNFNSNDSGNCCGDIDVILTMPLSDALSAKLDTNYYPEDKLAEAHVSMDYKLNDKITLTGKVGVVQNASAPNTQELELLARYALGTESALTLHYYDGSDYKPYLGLDLTWDTTLLGG